MKSFLLFFLLVGFAGLLYGDQDHNAAFRYGYVEGYDHGFRDRQANIGFDFRHDYEYRGGERGHERYDNHQSCDFRVGYLEGYADGYFRKAPLFPVETYSHGAPGLPSPGVGGVILYTEAKFKGSALHFDIGQYPRLEGKFNDSVSSVRMDGNVRVILFDQDNFRGQRIILERDSYDLGAFRNKAASMIVEPLGYPYGR